MTQALTKPSKTSLYDRDLNLWLETAIAQLKVGDFHNLDIANLVEELEGLAGRDRRELENRLTTLLEHLLKCCYVRSDYDYTGWVRTINRTRMEIYKILRQSPRGCAI
jgi:cellulose biosynthesis protein BcsQ